MLLTVALGTATADDPETITTRLEPGLNFVGWVGPTTLVAELFADVPEIDVAYAWNASEQRWLSASPDVPESLHSLRTLRTGSGLVLRIDSTEAVVWSRPLVRGSGWVWLARGFNLVPWVGINGGATETAHLSGHPWFLGAHIWDPALDQYQTYDPLMPTTGGILSAVNPGDALWIQAGDGSGRYWEQRPDSLSQIRGILTGPSGAPFVGFGVTAIAVDQNDT